MITAIQILQLLTVTYIWRVVPDRCPDYEQFPSEYFLVYLLPHALVPVYLLVFFEFFIEQYLLASRKAE